MADLAIAFRLPLPGWPRAVFESNYSFRGGRLVVDGAEVVTAATRDELERGVSGAIDGVPVDVRLVDHTIAVTAAGAAAPREDRLRAPPSRSAWIHAVQALAGSAAGFVASYLYLRKADALTDAWSHKMGIHMAAWHLLLTFTLFPASVWGQRIGIRIVQLVSFLFFAIHAGIAIANTGASFSETPGIAIFNAASGALFLVATFYGNRAHRDMDPVAALGARRAR